LAKVQIDVVALEPAGSGGLAERGLDAPHAGDAADGHVLRIRGLARGARQDVTGFDLVCRGQVIESVKATARSDGRPGAALELAASTLELPCEFRVAVRAVLADGSRARIATLAGSRSPLPPAPIHGPVPLLVSTIGRSGSTMVTNLLGRHPECVTYHPWTAEVRVIEYWTAVLRGLARPASLERQVHQPLGLGRMWWVGQPGEPALVADHGPALAAIAAAGLPGLTDFCRIQIGRVGAALAREAGKPAARHYVEKAQPDRVRSSAEVMEELDPRTREILLVRDLRDTLCSMRSYAAKSGAPFGPPGDPSVEEQLRWLRHTSGRLLADYADRRREAAYLLRYEDLIAEPAATITSVLRFAALDAAPETVALMLAALDAHPDMRDAHVTSTSPAESVGRWRRELTPAQQALAEELLRPQLDALGYE
jgi:hypothetical protein